MSKVEVKQQGSDSWRVRGEGLYQIRGRRSRLVVDAVGLFEVTTWIDEHPIDAQNIPQFVAHDWIAKVGGTVVEEREEEVPAKVVAHLDVTASEDNGEVHLSVEGSQSCKWRDREPDLYRRIHIAGVTT